MCRWRLARWALGAAALALACATPFFGEPRWVRVTTAHFEVLSSAGAGPARELAQALERFRVLVLPLRPERANLPRVAVYAFADPEAWTRIAPAGEPAFFLSVGPRPALAVDTRADAAREVLFHEYVHLLLAGVGRASPAWYEEGLAQLFSSAELEESQARVGKRPASIGLRVVYGTPLSVRRILTLQDRRSWPAETATMFGVESWALAHYFYTGFRAGYPKRSRELGDYLARVAAGEPALTAFEQAFGTSPEAFETEVLPYMGEGKFPYVVVPLRASEADLAVASERLPRDAWLFRLGELAQASGRPGVARELLEQALAADPDNARALAALGRERALELEPSDPEVARLLGDARLRAGQVSAAEDAYRASLALDPDDTAALAGLARAQAQPELPPGPAIASLESAVARAALPDADLALLARLYLRAGQPEPARALARALAQAAHGRRFATPESDAELDALFADSGLNALPRGLDPTLSLRMEVESPRDELRVAGIVGLAEVRGRAGLGEVLDHDVVIALDESGSTFERIRVPPSSSATADVASTPPAQIRIIDAELAAARRVLEQLDPAHTRASLVTFSAQTRVRAELGPVADANASVAAYSVHKDETGTSLASPLVEALKVFFANRRSEERRLRSVLLLSDGKPTAPNERVGQREATRVARTLGEAGVRVFAFAIGREAIESAGTFREIAELSGGQFIPVENPADVSDVLADIKLSGVENVEIRNLATGESARALRVFSDGSFDALVPLAPGENTLEFTARAPETQPLVLRRRVVFTPPARPTPEDLAQAEALREQLRIRTLETELARRARHGPRERERKVGVETETAPPAETPH